MATLSFISGYLIAFLYFPKSPGTLFISLLILECPDHGPRMVQGPDLAWCHTLSNTDFPGDQPGAQGQFLPDKDMTFHWAEEMWDQPSMGFLIRNDPGVTRAISSYGR